MMSSTKALQKKLMQEMTQATEVDRVPPPVETVSGGFVYYVKHNPHGSLLYCRRPVDSSMEQVLMDSDELYRAHGYELRNLLVSDDHMRIACLAAKDASGEANTESSSLLIYRINGSDSVAHEETLGNVFNFVFGGSDTIFYTELNDKLRAYRVCGHRIGQQQARDIDIYTEADEECFVDITRTKDKRFYVINSSTLDSSEAHVFSSDHDFWQQSSALSNRQPIRLVRQRQRNVEYYVDHHKDEFIILTNSPKNDDIQASIEEPLAFRLVRSASASPASEHWEELLDVRSDERIEDVEIFQDYLMVSIKRHGRPAVLIYSRLTNSRAELPLPYNGDCAVKPEPNPQFDSTTVRLCFSSPVHLDSVAEYDMATLKQHRSWASAPLHINPKEYVIRHVNVPSGSANVPLTLIHHESAALSGAPPMLLRVYGAYGVSLEPEFRLEDIPLLLRGWAVALVHVRGGGELGREWYTGGKCAQKINSIKDYLACSRYLLDKGWATTQRLAATGVSAGGLVVGAALNMNPEYFRAAALHVPFVDPLSAMLSPDLPLTSVEFAEWGNPLADKAAYSSIQQYAPYENVRRIAGGSGGCAPSILVTAGGQDQRVSVWQPAKWVARLRSVGGYSGPSAAAATCSHAPKLIFDARMDAGHFHLSSGGGFVQAQALRNAFLITETS
ncbi:hypothetical protein GGI12_000369 [Dipsacomyces acuminosporus]|nr:hypothetical protein GGI12_000369 [Dipsacomyces acuminosporus]